MQKPLQRTKCNRLSGSCSLSTVTCIRVMFGTDIHLQANIHHLAEILIFEVRESSSSISISPTVSVLILTFLDLSAFGDLMAFLTKKKIYLLRI